MADLSWTRDPLSTDPRKGFFRLAGHNQNYYLSTGDGGIYTQARPSRTQHEFAGYGLFRALARVRAGGDVIGDVVVNIPDPDTPPPAVTVTQHRNRPFLHEPPYYLGNLHLVVSNASPTFAEEYTIDWGGPQDWPEPNRSTRVVAPGDTVYGNQPEGDYTATVTHVPTGKTATVDYTVSPEITVDITHAAPGSRTVTATIAAMVALRRTEDPDLVSASIEWGDGTGHAWEPATVGDTADHTYTGPGTYTAMVCTSYDGSGVCYEQQITIP